VKNRADQLEAFSSIVEKGMNVKQAEDYINEVAAAADGQGSGRRQSGRRLQVVKDIRIFLNSFKEAVKAVRRAGIEAEMAETDEGERIRIVVTVAKRKTGQAMPQK
jgi:ParB family chromosome partitioning protein